MIRGTDPNSERFLSDMSDLKKRMDDAQFRISSGRNVNKASDDPDRLPNLLQMRGELSASEQSRTNLSRTQTEVDTAEAALQQSVTVLDRVRVLAAQAATDTVGPAERAGIASEIDTLLNQLVVLSAANVEGRYIFSGDMDDYQPYNVNLDLDQPLSLFQGSATTREIMHPSGARFRVARTAEEIFDNPDPTRNVFQAVNQLRLALRAGEGGEIRATLGGLQSAATHLNSELAFYGSVQNQVAQATDFAYKQELRLKKQIGNVEDADLTEAILEMNQLKLQQEASLRAQASRSRLSLFDMLG